MAGEKILFDYGKLRGKIVEKYGTIQEFSRAMGRDPGVISHKLNGLNYFTQKEIVQAEKLLGLKPDTVYACFFTQKV